MHFDKIIKKSVYGAVIIKGSAATRGVAGQAGTAWPVDAAASVVGRGGAGRNLAALARPREQIVQTQLRACFVPLSLWGSSVEFLSVAVIQSK